MRNLSSLEDAQLSRPSVVSIGVFDGVHRGHQHLIRQLVDYSGTTSQIPVVLTFFPYPDMVIHGPEPGYYLTLPERKAELLGELGVEVVITHPFDDSVRHIRAEVFVGKLLQYLKMASLWVGADFAMGYKREGNVDYLRQAAHARGFELRVVDLMDAGGVNVSSSRIREALAAGDVVEAARLLGRPHRVPGEVIRGAGRGQTIGIPTANLSFPSEQAIPARGVYAAWVHVEDKAVSAVVNIGVRPTFDGTSGLTVEAHLLDFSEDLYGKQLALDFVDRLREERKFDGVAALVSQIHRDIGQARLILETARTG